jgi:hypothetical protein
MTPREKILAAMELRVPTRVPLMCQLSIGHMLLQLGVSPVEFWNDADVFANGLTQIRDIYGFDGILVSLHGHDPEWSRDIRSLVRTMEGVETITRSGERILYPFDDLPAHKSGIDGNKRSLAVITVNDLPPSLDYIPVSQGLRFKIHPAHRFDIFKKVLDKAGPEFSIHGEVTSPFDYYLDFFGHENALMGLIDEPQQATMVLGHFAELVRDLAVDMCAAGVDAIKISSPFASSSFISTESYREFVLPFERTVVASIQSNKVFAYIHTCGAIQDRLELIFESGARGIECLDPPPLGNVELGEAKQRIGRLGFIKGNIDSVNTLLNGTDDEILGDARQRIQTGKQGGGFILSTACSVAPRVERRKLQLLREAVERWG